MLGVVASLSERGLVDVTAVLGQPLQCMERAMNRINNGTELNGENVGPVVCTSFSLHHCLNWTHIKRGML